MSGAHFKRLCIYVEGQSEERFCNALLIPHLSNFGIDAFAILCRDKQGGHVHNYDALWPDLVRLLKQERGLIVTTMFDLYHLPKNFPGKAGAVSAKPPPDYRAYAQHLEQAWQKDIEQRLTQSYAPRFVPHLVLHEYEALLFSDPVVISQVLLAPNLAEPLDAIRRKFDSPEAINHDTPPGKRLEQLHRPYNKPNDGVQIAERIGLPRIREHCPAFRAWVEKLERLGTANPAAAAPLGPVI